MENLRSRDQLDCDNGRHPVFLMEHFWRKRTDDLNVLGHVTTRAADHESSADSSEDPSRSAKRAGFSFKQRRFHVTVHLTRYLFDWQISKKIVSRHQGWLYLLRGRTLTVLLSMGLWWIYYSPFEEHKFPEDIKKQHKRSIKSSSFWWHFYMIPNQSRVLILAVLCMGVWWCRLDLG